MDRIAGQQNAAALKLLGHQRVAGIPGRARDELNVELRAEHDVAALEIWPAC